MKVDEILKKAEQFLNRSDIEYVLPEKIGRKDNHEMEVIFLVPYALMPGVTVAPPDVRVWVNTSTGKVTLIEQM